MAGVRRSRQGPAVGPSLQPGTPPGRPPGAIRPCRLGTGRDRPPGGAPGRRRGGRL